MKMRVLQVVCLAALLSGCEETEGVTDTDPDLGRTDASTRRDGHLGEAGAADGASDVTGGADMAPLVGLFVRGADGQDQPGRGTMAEPFKTIQYAIDQATAPVAVHVAAGAYTEDVALRGGVSLLGGYSATDWNDRAPRDWDGPAHRTTIKAVIGIAVKAGKGVGSQTLLEGFYLEGGIETHDHHSHGVYIYDDAAPLIRSNKIHGGSGDMYSTGITTVGGAAPTITRNLILGGAAPVTYALRLNETTALVASNVLSGRGGTDESYGVLVNNASPVIANNTIDGGDAASAYGLFLFSSTAPEVSNNIISAAGQTKGYGLYEATISGDPALVQNNDFFGCTTALYHDWGSSPADITELAALHGLTDTAASGNVAEDPGFVSAADQHLQASSPAEVREGGRDLSALGITADMDGRARTVPWSIGAYELD